MLVLSAEAHLFVAFVALIPFTIFSVSSHMRGSVSFVLVFIVTMVTSAPATFLCVCTWQFKLPTSLNLWSQFFLGQDIKCSSWLINMCWSKWLWNRKLSPHISQVKLSSLCEYMCLSKVCLLHEVLVTLITANYPMIIPVIGVQFFHTSGKYFYTYFAFNSTPFRCWRRFTLYSGLGGGLGSHMSWAWCQFGNCSVMQ